MKEKKNAGGGLGINESMIIYIDAEKFPNIGEKMQLRKP